MGTRITEAALEYAALGYRVIPLKPGSKVPDLRHWPEEASNDPAVVRAHFAQSLARARAHGEFQEPNVGIVTGNGLAVLDIDIHHGGTRPDWAIDTLTVRTASGGLHLYYAVDRPVPNSVGRIAPGVDVRGERGQVAAPPSVIRFETYTKRAVPWPEHPFVTADVRNGYTEYLVYDYGEYAFEADRPIASIDPDLLIPADQRQDYLGRTGRRFEWRDEVPVGERNNYLTSLAGYLFATGESFNEVLAQVHAESDQLGFRPKQGEILNIVNSVGRYHRADQPGI